jgi:hypothetical protein
MVWLWRFFSSLSFSIFFFSFLFVVVASSCVGGGEVGYLSLLNMESSILATCQISLTYIS